MKAKPLKLKLNPKKIGDMAPTMVARVINLGSITNSFRNAARWLASKIDYEEPVIMYYKTASPVLHLMGTRPFSYFINLDKVPEGFELTRTDTGAESGVIYFDSGQTTVRIYCPSKKVVGIQPHIMDSITEVLKEDYNIDVIPAPWRKNSNDMVFMKDGKYKKFSGIAYMHVDNMLAFTMLFDFNADKIPGLYRFDTQKMLQKGDVKEISDIVGGLHEINTDIGEEVIPKIINRLSQKMRWEPQDSVLLEEEQKAIDDIVVELSNEENSNWILTGKR